MPSATPFSLAIKAIFLWVAVMLPTLITLVTRDYTVNIILLTVMFPIMLAFLINMDKSPFIVKTSVIGVASMITFFVMYIIAKFVPKIQTALQDPGQNRATTITIILLIAGIYSVAMGTAGYFLPMFPIQALPGNMMGNMRLPTY
jgi:hypothetical protein